MYDPDEKLNAFLYELAEGKRTIRKIRKCVQTSVVRMFLNLDTSMSYATLDLFWHQLSEVAEQIFEHLVEHVKQLGALGNYQAADTTSIATPRMDDPDATGSYEATKKKYYFDYRFFLVVDVATEIPITARFIKRKEASKKDCIQVIREAFYVRKAQEVLADTGFDFIGFQQEIMNERILQIITNNPKNAGKPLPITYRVK